MYFDFLPFRNVATDLYSGAALYPLVVPESSGGRATPLGFKRSGPIPKGLPVPVPQDNSPSFFLLENSGDRLLFGCI